jgi:glycosyltransferase involved in cell wall biosynthesis
MSLPWHILTGEYPPDPGGVSDYTEQVARELARKGHEVHVWAPGRGSTVTESGVGVHRLEDGFTPRGLWALTKQAHAMPGPKRWLVQYVPQGFGLHGANLPFIAWLYTRWRDRVWMMYHEVAVPWRGAKLVALRLLQGPMAAFAGWRASRVFVSIPSWRDMLPLGVRHRANWLPIPSNIALEVTPEQREQARQACAPQRDAVVLGHFGTYSSWLRRTLRELVPKLLKEDERRVMLFLGRGGSHFVFDLKTQHPKLTDRVRATGDLPRSQLAANLSACDVLLQPYADGASSRRGSLMAGLALGCPIVTNLGHLSDSFWASSKALELAPTPDTGDLHGAASSLLATPERWQPMGDAAAKLYRATFSLDRTVQTLTEQAQAETA